MTITEVCALLIRATRRSKNYVISGFCGIELGKCSPDMQSTGIACRPLLNVQ
jgi:hypothetical protein